MLNRNRSQTFLEKENSWFAGQTQNYAMYLKGTTKIVQRSK